jgi:hypothetical protein
MLSTAVTGSVSVSGIDSSKECLFPVPVPGTHLEEKVFFNTTPLHFHTLAVPGTQHITGTTGLSNTVKKTNCLLSRVRIRFLVRGRIQIQLKRNGVFDFGP